MSMNRKHPKKKESLTKSIQATLVTRSLDDWARAQLSEQLRTQTERNELELQIGAMEGEGNLPGIAAP